MLVAGGDMRVAFFVFTASTFAAEVTLPPPASRKVDFEKDVQPLLSQKCYACHGQEVQQSGLRLDKRQNALRGGDYGPVIIPGNSATSKLIRRLVNGDGGLQMPPTGALSDEEIGMLRAWIDQGADFRIEVQDEAPPQPVDPKLAALITAARSGDTEAVRKLITANPASSTRPMLLAQRRSTTPRASATSPRWNCCSTTGPT